MTKYRDRGRPKVTGDVISGWNMSRLLPNKTAKFVMMAVVNDDGIMRISYAPTVVLFLLVYLLGIVI